MASASEVSVQQRVPAITGRNGLVDRYFYLFASLLIAAIVVWGFSHSIDQNLIHASPPRPLLLWFHGAAFSAWVLFFIFQSALVRTRNVKWHRFFGWFGVALGTVMVPIGIATAIAKGRQELAEFWGPDAGANLLVGFFDALAFGVFFALAIFCRKNPELLRRLMFIATCGLLYSAFLRFGVVGDHALFFPLVDLVIGLGVLRDLIVDRRVHKVYLIALPTLIVAQAFVTYAWTYNSAWWLRIAQAIIG